MGRIGSPPLAPLALLALLAGSVTEATGATTPPGGSPTDRPAAEASEPDLLVAVELDDVVLADALSALQAADGDVLLPLDQLAALLSLGIDVHPRQGRAEGFVIAVDRRFELDVTAGHASFDGHEFSLAPEDARIAFGDIYVAARRIEEWLPLDIRYDAHDALVIITAREQLPLQLRWEQARRLGLAARSSDVEPMGPRLFLPWALGDSPFIDTVVRLESSSRRGLVLDHSTHVSAELLGMGTEAFFTGSGNELLTQRRFTFGRRDPDAGLLGPVNASEFLVGDVFDSGLNLITRARSGTGIRLGNFPLERSDRFGAESLRGALPSGWLVELFQDGALVDMRTPGAAELYEFLDVPLHFGANELRLVFHGPHGEIREDVVRRMLGSDLVEDGEVHWRLTSVDGKDGGRQSAVVADLGINERMTLSSGAALVEMDDGTHRYVTAGMEAMVGPALARFDAVADLDGGMAAELSLQSRLGPIDVSLRHAELAGFLSNVFAEASDPLQRRTFVGLNAMIPMAGVRAFPVSVALDRSVHESGDTDSSLKIRVGAALGRTFVTNETSFRWADETLGGSLAEGRLLMRHRFDAFAVRGEIGYQIDDEFFVDWATLAAEAVVAGDWFVRAELSHDRTSASNRYAIGVERMGRAFGIGGELSLDDDGLTVAVVVRMGIARDPGSGRWLTRAEPLASMGAVSARPFLDLDGDGTRDADEPPFESTVRAGRSGSGQATGESGTAFLLAPAHRSVAVAVDPELLSDPLALPSPQAIHVVPRPGRVACVDLPVVLTGDIAGTVLLDEDGVQRPAGGAEVVLLAPSGDIVATARCAHDGFYNLTRVPPGRHRVTVRWERRRRPVMLVRDTVIDVPATGLILDGYDLRIIAAPESDVPLLASSRSASDAPALKSEP